MNLFIKCKIVVTQSLGGLAVLPHLAFASSEVDSSGTGSSFENPLAFSSFQEVLVAILDVLVILAMPIIVIFIVYAGFQYVTAQGNPTKIQQASQALMYALIGGAIILGAAIIGEVVENTINAVRNTT